MAKDDDRWQVEKAANIANIKARYQSDICSYVLLLLPFQKCAGSCFIL
jgi:hypothetical protein